MNLSNSEYYINREISWLDFNERVLEEAQDKTNPIFERLKFLAITASNLDEFFMVRVSGVIDQQQLKDLSEKAHSFVQKQYNCLNRSIIPALEKEGLYILTFDELNNEQIGFVKKYFESTILPILTPMAIDQSRPFPLLANKSLNIITEIENEEPMYAVVQVPSVIPRFLELKPSAPGRREYIFIENIIKKYISQLFIGYNVLTAHTFRITRNSDLLIEEGEADDLLIEIERSIKRRKWGDPVRLEMEKSISIKSCRYLEKTLELDEEDIYYITEPIDLSLFHSFTSQKGFEHLKDEPLAPVPVGAFINRDMFEVIRENDILVHHPYDSFDCVMNFISTAAKDPDVLAIKQTLYRVSGNSPIVASLIEAAENGKQVTVLVELKARFDEENNIHWAKKLENAGCHVVYGLVGLKIHCKMCLVVRREDDGIRRYLHLGTGNYNDSTAKIYTDLGFFTCKETYGKDITDLFNVLTGYSINRQYNKISVAPFSLRETFIKHIENEIKIASEGKYACVTAKMNSLVDIGIIQALYKASMAGVKIRLIIRGICCLKAGVPKLSENITVVSIVDRFLEHSRIYYFENDGSPIIYLSSADWMPRNLDRRVEAAFPVENRDLKEKLIEILELTLSDTVKLRIQQPDGSYDRVDRRGKESIRSQLVFHQMSKKIYETGLLAYPAEEALM